MSSHGDTTLPPTRRPRKSTSGLSPVRKAKDKENATVDVGATLGESRKKSRSKSIGPGGLDALKTGSGNRRVSLAAPSRPPPRSILKPTIPLLPEIPPHRPKSSASGSKGTPDRGSKSPNKDGTGSSGTKIALRTEEEQQAAAREREERERAQMEKEINDKREARRKSLANRRVSFAAEATLHTFHEMDYMQDSTTSTDSTRRASSIAAASPAPRVEDQLHSDASEPPSTPPEQVEETVPESPADQRQLHQKKRRRSSGIPPLNFNNPDDITMTSTVYDSDSEHGDSIAEAQDDEASDSNSDSDNDGTMMTMEAEEMTSASVASARSDATTGSTSGLEEALRLATQRAGTRAIDDGGEGDEEVIPAIMGWGKKANNPSAIASKDQENVAPHLNAPGMERISDQQDDDGTEMDVDMDMDMEMTRPVGGIIRQAVSPERDEGEDMSMDVTHAFGGILSQGPVTSQAGRTRASDEQSQSGDEPMELTMAIGNIQQSSRRDSSQTDAESNEDMSMELTTVIGGVFASKLGASNGTRRQIASPKPTLDGEDEEPMDMTMAVGQILSAPREEEDEDGDITMGMDVTTAVGRIIKAASPVKSRSEAKRMMEQEADQPESLSANRPATARSPPKQKSADSQTHATNAIPVESPGLSAFRGKGLRRSNAASASISPARTMGSPTSKSDSPSKLGARTPSQSRTPSRTPSPKRQVSPRRKSVTPRSKSPEKTAGVFQHDPSTGVSTPRVVLTPQRRRLSGVGADRAGLGSPRIAEIIDRRGSIGDSSGDFILRQPDNVRKAVAFEDPRVMEAEVDRERQDAEDVESGKRILEREADGFQEDRDATLNLKEMIQNLSPKKNPLKGRKSLHVGSAKGLLGKRPAELDDEDDEREDRDGVKRLKGHQSSPVKNVRLQQPPSKAETTGRMTRSTRRTLDTTEESTITPTTLSPSKSTVTTPRTQGRFKNVQEDQPSVTLDLETTAPLEDVEFQLDDQEKIHLQDFLNMTSIRFMELTTTKRRHTVAPTAPNDGQVGDKDDVSLERCVVAGACTVPMLELYQHSCRELKKYISEGRRIVREIETETLAENPPLFREYMSADPEFKVIMDNQFKNVKAHARLLSKAMWYEWRMKLQDGLKEGLVKTAEGMTGDEKLLDKQEKLVASVVPALVKRFESLEHEHSNLEEVAHELADCDPDELQSARSELVSTEKSIEEKTRKIAELRKQLQEAEVSIEQFTKQKQKCYEDIKESEKIREECRGWSSTEISVLKAKVEELEKQHGWAITGISGTTLSMTYQREIELVFDIASFRPGQQNSRIDLWYIANNRERSPLPCTPEKEFFLQCIRDHIRALPQAHTKLSRMLGVVRAAWDKANAVTNHVRFLNLTYPTQVNKTSDSSIAIRSSLLMAPLATKIEVVLSLQSLESADGVDVAVVPHAAVIYGEHFNAPKMTEFLSKRLGNRVFSKEEKQTESWGDVVAELHATLLARGKK
ncbi:Kinetochore protein spc7 [Pleurostoma richardsiae]|uniref:Kinetochore protein spc7 n=1 Tax=Pleurostoma richardsiae TaxID=41990 RepID=A0AA38VUY5_9PEZI|nr:Kinetochore protein spc7 [Pleurostoma richardsiae]